MNNRFHTGVIISGDSAGGVRAFKDVDAAAKGYSKTAASGTSSTTRFSGALGGLTNRVKTLVGAGALAGLALSLGQVQMQSQALESTFNVALGSAERGAVAFDFVRSESQRLGLELQTTAQSFASFQAAAQGTSLEGEGAAKVFSAVSEAATALGLSSSTTEGALLALQQMVSKGVVSAEELRGQLGERLPGAFNLAAEAMGMTTAELGKALQNGEIMAEDLLPKLADSLTNRFGAAAIKAADNLTANVNRMKGSLFDLRDAINDAGSGDLLNSLTKGATLRIQQITAAIRANEGALGASENSLVDWGEAWRAVSEQSVILISRVPDAVRATSVLIVAFSVDAANQVVAAFKTASNLAVTAWEYIKRGFIEAMDLVISTAVSAATKLADVFDALGADQVAAQLRTAADVSAQFSNALIAQSDAAIEKLAEERQAIAEKAAESRRVMVSVRDDVLAEAAVREEARRAAIAQAGSVKKVTAEMLGGATATKKLTEQTEQDAKAAAKAAKARDQLAKAVEKYTQSAIAAEAKRIDALRDEQEKVRVLEREIELVTRGLSLDEARSQSARESLALARDKAVAAQDDLEASRLQAQMDQQSLQDRLKGIETAREAAKKAAEDTSEEWRRQAEQIRGSLTDALLRGFEDGKGLAQNFIDTLKNLFSTLVLRPIIEFAVSPITGAIQSALGGIGISGASGAGSALFGGGAAGLLGGLNASGNALGGLFAGGVTLQGLQAALPAALGLGAAGYLGGSALNNVLGGNSGGSLGASLGSVVGFGLGGPLGAAAGGLFGNFAGNALGSALGIGGSAPGSGFASSRNIAGQFSASGFSGTDSRDLDFLSFDFAEFQNNAGELIETLDRLFKGAFTAGSAAADALGTSVDGFSFALDATVNSSGRAADQERARAELQEQLTQAVGSAADALAQQALPGLEAFQAEGETLLDTLVRVAGQAQAADAILGQMGLSIDATGLQLVETTQAIVEAFGGSLDAMNSAVSSFAQNFLSEEERFELATQALLNELNIVGVTLPLTRQGFADLVRGLDLTSAAGRETFAALTQLSGAANQFYTAAEAAAQGTVNAASVMAQTGSQMGQIVSNAINAAQTASSAASTAVAATTTVSNTTGATAQRIQNYEQRIRELERSLENAARSTKAATQSSSTYSITAQRQAEADRARQQAAEAAARATEEAARALERLRSSLSGFDDNIEAAVGSIFGMDRTLANAYVKLAGSRGQDAISAGGSVLSALLADYRDDAREIEQGYRDQVSAVEEALRAELERLDTVARAQREANEAQLRALLEQRDVATDLFGFVDSLDRSGALGTPLEQVNAALSQFRGIVGQAEAGDLGAARQISGRGSELIDLARSVYGSGGAFNDIFNEVRNSAAGLAASINPTDAVIQDLQAASIRNNELLAFQTQKAIELAERQIQRLELRSQIEVGVLKNDVVGAIRDLQAQVRAQSGVRGPVTSGGSSVTPIRPPVTNVPPPNDFRGPALSSGDIDRLISAFQRSDGSGSDERTVVQLVVDSRMISEQTIREIKERSRRGEGVAFIEGVIGAKVA